jgi:hypothetical protein
MTQAQGQEPVGSAVGGQQPEGEQPGGLLAAEAARAAEQGDSGGGGEQTPAPTVESLQAALGEMRGSFQAEVDRRVNQVVSTLRGEMAQMGQQPSAVPVAPPAAPLPSPAGPPQTSSADLREARMVYREFVGESLQFVGPQERALAQDLSSMQLLQAIQSGMDPDTAGRHVASQVTSRILDARGMYEASVVNALRRSGRLSETPATPGLSSVRGGQQLPAGRQDAASSFAKGAAMAEAIGRGKAPPAGQ